MPPAVQVAVSLISWKSWVCGSGVGVGTAVGSGVAGTAVGAAVGTAVGTGRRRLGRHRRWCRRHDRCCGGLRRGLGGLDLRLAAAIALAGVDDFRALLHPTIPVVAQRLDVLLNDLAADFALVLGGPGLQAGGVHPRVLDLRIVVLVGIGLEVRRQHHTACHRRPAAS